MSQPVTEREMAAVKNAPRSILVLRFGSLGDTVVALPALSALRSRFPGAHITLCSELTTVDNIVKPVDVIGHRSFVDEFLYWPRSGSYLGRRLEQMRIRFTHRWRKWDLGIALEEFSPNSDGNRDFYTRILHWMGCRQILVEQAFQLGLHRADALVRVLNPLGIKKGPCLFGFLRYATDPAAEKRADNLLASAAKKIDARFVAVAPTSNMPVKCWPVDRYDRVLQSLMREYNVLPVVFGSGSEISAIKGSLGQPALGVMAFGQPISIVTALLRRCAMYLGNDNGVMHLAAAVGLPCVAIFSSRDAVGRWVPYGPGHAVFRTDIDCAGCMLAECHERRMECVMRINEDDVLHACRSMLRKGRAITGKGGER